MIDDGLRSLFHTHLRQFHWQAIESGLTGGGIPDSNFCINGIEGWVEHKATATAKVHTLNSDQVGWHLRRARAGGRTFFAVRYRHRGGPRKGPAVDRLYLYRGIMAKELFLTGLRNPPLGWWDGGPTRWNWGEISRLLSS
jgi:hypothetical protein